MLSAEPPAKRPRGRPRKDNVGWHTLPVPVPPSLPNYGCSTVCSTATPAANAAIAATSCAATDSNACCNDLQQVQQPVVPLPVLPSLPNCSVALAAPLAAPQLPPPTLPLLQHAPQLTPMHLATTFGKFINPWSHEVDELTSLPFVIVEPTERHWSNWVLRLERWGFCPGRNMQTFTEEKNADVTSGRARRHSV